MSAKADREVGGGGGDARLKGSLALVQKILRGERMILSHVCRIMLKVSVSRRRNESMTLCASAPERNNPPLVIWISSEPCFQQLKKHCYCVAISMNYKVDIETRYGQMLRFSYNFSGYKYTL